MQDTAGTHATPSEVVAEGGCVLVNGPGGIAISMTPEAAAETSDRMLVASTMAAGQRTFARMYKPSDGG